MPEDFLFAERKDDERPGLSKDDEQFLTILNNEVSLDDSGNITFPLPFKHNDPVLPSNQAEVFHRTKNTLKRLSRDESKLSQCIDVMNKYISNGHVQMVPEAELTPKRPGHSWWIPVFPGQSCCCFTQLIGCALSFPSSDGNFSFGSS